MHLTIFSGAARPKVKSNTAQIIEAFREGFQRGENNAEVWYLSDKKQWNTARNAFVENTDILFVLPLYVENVPGIMLEFLESLPQKEQPGTRLSFIVQGGFPEASQSRCCESFLETLPDKLGCEYGGTLIRGDMFGVGILRREFGVFGRKMAEKMLQPFAEVGILFARYGCFSEEIISQFSSPEYLSEKQIRQSETWGRYVQKWTMNWIAKRLGCKESLDAKPYGSETL